MKLLVTARGPSLSSPVSPHFSSARCFVLFDSETQEIRFFANRMRRDAQQTNAVRAARMASLLGATLVIASHCGPGSRDALEAVGIRVMSGARGTVGDVLDAYLAGRLEPGT